MPWDPLNVRPRERRWLWLSVAFWAVVLLGPSFIENLQPVAPMRFIPDFFQEYASARNWFDGRPIYADHHETAPRLLGLKLNDPHAHVFVNAHPPTSVLLAAPIARFDFATAFIAWNLISLAALATSLWIVRHQLRIPLSPWSISPVVTLLLLCFPLWEQCRLGQRTLVLLLLVTGTWGAERSGHPWLAGSLLGTAAAIMLFPGFLLLYYALRGRWRVVAAGFIAIAGLTGLTAIVLGADCYRNYFSNVLPGIQWFRVGWNNDSLWGFWSRLFDPAPEHVRDRSLTEPLFHSPALAKSLSLISCASVAAVLAWAVRRDAKGQKTDLTFALAVTTMLLVSPICWEHYLLLLLVPLAVVWLELPPSRFARTLFLVIVAAFWMGYPMVWTAFGLNGRTAKPLHSRAALERKTLTPHTGRIRLSPGSGDRVRVQRDRRLAVDDLVDQAVGAGFLGRHEAVAIGILLQPLEGLPRVLLIDLVELLFHADEFFRVDQDFGGGSFHARQGLMDHDAAVRQGVALALGAGGEQQRAHAGALADAVGRDVAGDPLHGVVNRQPGGHAAAGAVDVEMNIGLGILMGQDDHLGDDQVGDRVVDRGAQDDDSILKEAGIDIHRPFFTTAAFDHDGDQWHGSKALQETGGALALLSPFSVPPIRPTTSSTRPYSLAWAAVR